MSTRDETRWIYRLIIGAMRAFGDGVKIETEQSILPFWGLTLGENNRDKPLECSVAVEAKYM
jgi:hypothetical protein